MEVDESPEVTAGAPNEVASTATSSSSTEEEKPVAEETAAPEEEEVAAPAAAPEPSSSEGGGVLRSILSEEELLAIPAETGKKIEGHYEQKLEEFLTAKALCETAKTNVGKHFRGVVCRRTGGLRDFGVILSADSSPWETIGHHCASETGHWEVFLVVAVCSSNCQMNFDQFLGWLRVCTVDVRAVVWWFACVRKAPKNAGNFCGFVLILDDCVYTRAALAARNIKVGWEG